MHVFAGTRCPELNKIVYLDNRRYLPTESSLRKEKDGFPMKNEELKPPPAKRTFSAIHNHRLAFQNSLTR